MRSETVNLRGQVLEARGFAISPRVCARAAVSWSTGRTAMCQYVFHCRDCNKEFTLNLHMTERGSSQVACPHCGGQRVEQLVAAFSAVTSKKS